MEALIDKVVDLDSVLLLAAQTTDKAPDWTENDFPDSIRTLIITSPHARQLLDHYIEAKQTALAKRAERNARAREKRARDKEAWMDAKKKN